MQELLSGCVAAIAADLQLEDSSPSGWLLHSLATHAARGLATLHERDLAHGDIKPHNIMWSADQAAFVLIDFGLSTRAGEHYAHRVHSPEYSSPETRMWNGHVIQQQEKQRSHNQHWLGQFEVPHPHKETSNGLSASEELLKSRLQPQPETALCDAPSRPGQAADVWALGYTIARIATGAPIFPDGLPSTQEEVDLTVMNRFDKLKKSYEPLFLQDLTLYVRRCLRVRPDERETASQLSGSWSCAPGLQPHYFDLNSLPTAVLRIANVADTSLIDQDDLSDLLAICDGYGKVVSHRMSQSEAGVLFLRFSMADSAETAVQHLQGRDWRGRTLVPTFYPPLLYQKLEV